MSDVDHSLMLGISGMRGVIGASLTPAVAVRYGCALGTWFRRQHAKLNQPTVVVGRDSRPSGSLIEKAVVSGLMACGCRVVRLGICSTPAVAVMIGHHHAQGGVVITASHNPVIWNGIKALRHDGTAPPREQALALIDDFHHDRYLLQSVEQLGMICDDLTAPLLHAGKVLEQLDVPAIQKRKFKVVLDSVCGAGGVETAHMLRSLGVELIHLHSEPTGWFPHPPEPTVDHLTELCEAVKHHHADVGFAQDPDADRLAMVDHTGRYIGEEYTLALAALHVLSKTQPSVPATTTAAHDRRVLVANLSTSRMIDDLAQAHDATVVRTPVGEAHVAQAMREHQAMLGGEGNGGVILPAISFVRDSLLAIGLTLELLAHRQAHIAHLIQQFPAYTIVKQKRPVDAALVTRLPALMQQAFPQARMDTRDGVRVDLPDRWIHVRASNTEPIIRLIAEAPDDAQAQALLQQVHRALDASQ